MSRSSYFSADDIMRLTDNGLAVFERELGRVPLNQNISSPLRSGDSKPSFGIYPYNGIWFFKDFADDNLTGNAIKFIQLRYNLSYGKAIRKIVGDLGLGDKKSYIPVNQLVTKTAVKIPKSIEFEPTPLYDNDHANYYLDYGLDPDFLMNDNIFQVKTWAIDKVVQKRFPGELTFAIHAPDINKTKILRINVPPEEKWKNEVPNEYLWFFHEYAHKKLDKLFVVKSVKDREVMKKLGEHAISTNNESAKILLSNNVEKINNIAKRVIVLYGSDPQGVRECTKITKETGWEYFNTPKKLLDWEINDPAELVKQFNYRVLYNKLKIKNMV